MGQEYSTHDINSVSYPEAIGYIERHKFKGKRKYPMKKAEVKSFSRIPYSKYVSLGDRSTDAYKKSLKQKPAYQNGTVDRQPGGRIVNIAPPSKVHGSPTNARKYVNSASSNGRVSSAGNKQTVKARKSSAQTMDRSLNLSTTEQYSLNTSSNSNITAAVRDRITSPNTSLASLKEIRERNITTPHEIGGKKSKFIPRNSKEKQLQKIYVKPEDLVLEQQNRRRPKSTKKTKSVTGKDNDDQSPYINSKKKKALFKIRKKMKIEPQSVYLESPFRRQKTIRVKKNQITPGIPVQRVEKLAFEHDGPSTSEQISRPGTSESRRPASSSSTIKDRIRPTSSTKSKEFSVVGTKANFYYKDDEEEEIPEEIIGNGQDELTRLFERRTNFPPARPKLERPQTASLDNLTDPKSKKSKQSGTQIKNTISRPRSSPYTNLPHLAGGVVFPGYRGKSGRGKTNMLSLSKRVTENKKSNNKIAINPAIAKTSKIPKSGKFRGKVGPLTIVRGNKNATKIDPKTDPNEPKVRLKWFNVLHRSHYQNRIDSIYDPENNNADNVYLPQRKESYESDDLTNVSKLEQSFEEDKSDVTLKNDTMSSARTEDGSSMNTYSDSVLTNTTVSSAAATVLGSLGRDMREVEYEPSVTSEFSVFSTRQTRTSQVIEYDGDGETDLDKPLRFKNKKSPDVLRKDILQQQQAYFRNHPGVEDETDTDSETSTLTGDKPTLGHVQKMMELFGALQYNKTYRRQKIKASQNRDYIPQNLENTNKKTTSNLNNDHNHYQPSFLNTSNPSHLFAATGKDEFNTERVKTPRITVNKSKTENKMQVLVDKSNIITATQKSAVKNESKSISKSKGQNVQNKTGKSTSAAADRLKSSPYGTLPNNKLDIKNVQTLKEDSKAKTVKPLPFLNKKAPKALQSTSKQEISTETKQLTKLENKNPQQRKATSSPPLKPVKQVLVSPALTHIRQVIVSPINSDDDDSLAGLEDAETLAAQASQNKEYSNSNPNTPSYLIPQTNIDEFEENGYELDEVLKEILNDSKQRKTSANINRQQENGMFKIETAASPFARPLNPLHSYSRTPTAMNQSYNVDDRVAMTPDNVNHNTDVRKSVDFQNIRSIYENRSHPNQSHEGNMNECSTIKATSETTTKDGVLAPKPFYQNKASSSKNVALNAVNHNVVVQSSPTIMHTEGTLEEEPGTLSSDQNNVMIDGNYDDYARTREKKERKKSAEKGGIYLPHIVNKETFQIYSRHGPVSSKAGPVVSTKGNIRASETYNKGKSIANMSESYKGNKFNKYQWKSGTPNATGNTGSLYNTLVQNRYKNKSPTRSIHTPTVEATKM